MRKSGGGKERCIKKRKESREGRREKSKKGVRAGRKEL